MNQQTSVNLTNEDKELVMLGLRVLTQTCLSIGLEEPACEAKRIGSLLKSSSNQKR